MSITTSFQMQGKISTEDKIFEIRGKTGLNNQIVGKLDIVDSKRNWTQFFTVSYDELLQLRELIDAFISYYEKIKVDNKE